MKKHKLKCLYCGSVHYGVSFKKYCCDECRKKDYSFVYKADYADNQKKK